MPVCAVANSGGFLYVAPSVEMDSCTGYAILTPQEYAFVMDYTQVTAGEIAQAFGFGFSLVFVGGYLSTYAIQIALRLIRML